MTLSLLVDQIVNAQPKQGRVKTKLPRCPMCKSANRTLVKNGEAYADYCKECTSIINKRRY